MAEKNIKDVVMQKNYFLQEQKSGKISRTDLRGAMKKKCLVDDWSTKTILDIFLSFYI